MFSTISRGVLRKSKGNARLETNQSALQSVGADYVNRQDRSRNTLPRHPQPQEKSTPHKQFNSQIPEHDQPDQPEVNRVTAQQNPRSFQSGTQTGSPRILSIGGGKGGIGKSFISANLAVCLAKQGYSVSLVDLDLGAANLHTCLGVPNPKVGIFDFVNSRIEDLRDIAVETGVPGLKLYGGGQEFWQQVRPQSVQKVRLISKLQSLDSDYVILDLGAGTHVNTLDFFIFSHAGLLVVVPEPTSIENAYVFLKSVMYRKLQSIIKAIREESSCEELLAGLGNPKIATPPFAQLEKFAANNSVVGNKIIKLIRMTKLGIVMNQVRTKGDVDIGHSMSKICDRYFGFNSSFLGVTHYDDEAWKSVRNRKPICIERPSAVSASDLANLSLSIANDLIPNNKQRKETETG